MKLGRRGFLKMLGFAPAAPVAAALLPSLEKAASPVQEEIVEEVASEESDFELCYSMACTVMPAVDFAKIDDWDIYKVRKASKA